MRSIVQQKVKYEQPMAQGGHPQGAPNMTEFMTYWPYTHVELVDLGKQFQQTQGGPLLAWLLQLWDTEVGPAPVGFVRVLKREVKGLHARHHCVRVKVTPEGAQTCQSPVWVTWMQIWADLCEGAL